MKRFLVSALLLFVATTGCEKKTEAPQTAKMAKPVAAVKLELPTPKNIFNEPTIAYKFELPSEALQVWRQTKSVKPALVLFSIHPFLERVDEERKSDISELIRSGDATTFRNRGSYYRIDPAMVSTQTVSAAIDNELFSEIIWVTPTQIKPEEISLTILRKQMVEAGFLTEEEGKSLIFDDGVTSGTVRGLPFRAVHPDALPDIEKPVVVHIDTGYFNGMFKNEVASPLYDILHQTIMRIMQNEWKTYAVTLSYSTQELVFSLDVRFLITAMAQIIEDPQLLQKRPEGWRLHAEAMYMGNMYMESKSQDLIEEATVAAPDDPIIVYTLSQIRFKQGRPDEAFALLDKAVQLDPGYATAYIQLAETGLENGQLEKSLELLDKAIRIYPENPFLNLRRVDLLIKMGRTEKAIEEINDLQKLPWSDYFHSGARQNLKDMAEFARDPQPIQPVIENQEKK